MKNCNHNEIHVGTSVTFIRNASTNPTLKTGIVTRIYDDDSACTVNQQINVPPHRIMKNDPFAIMRRIGWLRDDYQTCVDEGVMTEELRKDLSEFCNDFGITKDEIFQIIKEELTISEIVCMLSKSK